MSRALSPGEIREVYCDQVRRWAARRGTLSTYGSNHMACWDGGEDASGRVHRPVWPDFARVMAERGWDGADYIRFHLERVGIEPVPTPRQLLGPKMLGAFKPRTDATETDLIDRFDVEMRAARMCFAKASLRRNILGWTDAQIQTLVLTDPGMTVSPLMRYCLAVSLGRQDLATQWKDRAVEQYRNDPDGYDAVWGLELIPDAVRNEVRPVAGQRSQT